MVLLFGWFIFSATQAAQMAPPTKREKWFPDDHMITALGAEQDKFFGGDQASYVDVNLVWGINGINRDDYNTWQPIDRGSATFDSNFNPTSPAAHKFFDELCADLRTRACTAEGCMDGTKQLARKQRVSCFFQDWRQWYEEQVQCDVCADDPLVDGCAAWHAADPTCSTVLADIDGIGSYHNTVADACPRTCGRCSEAQLADSSLCPSIAYADLPAGTEYLASLKAFRDNPVHYHKYFDKIGVIGGALKYLSVRIESTLEVDQPQSLTNSVRDIFDGIITQYNGRAPAGVGVGFHEAGRAWTWAVTQQGLVTNVYQVYRISGGTFL
jgi:hypothetical protein